MVDIVDAATAPAGSETVLDVASAIEPLRPVVVASLEDAGVPASPADVDGFLRQIEGLVLTSAGRTAAGGTLSTARSTLTTVILVALSLMMVGLPYTSGAIAKGLMKEAIGDGYTWLVTLLTIAGTSIELPALASLTLDAGAGDDRFEVVELPDAVEPTLLFTTTEPVEATAEQVEIAYRLDVNEFRGLVSPQLMVEHIEVPEAGS